MGHLSGHPWGATPYPSTMPEPIADFFRQNQWANAALIDACRGLTDEQLDTTVEGVFGSIRSTLQHIAGKMKKV